MKFKKKIIVAKIEAAYGTDSAPGVANGVLAYNIEITPLEAVTEEREQAVGFGANEIIHAGVYASIEFDVELAGSGAVDTPPAYAELLRACSHSQTITALTDVQFDQVSALEESVTLYFDLHGQKHPFTGVRGSIGYNLKALGKPMIHFKLVGLFGDPVSAASIAPSFTAWNKALPVNNANTTFTLHGYAARLAELTLDQNNETSYRNLVGVEEIAVGGRAWSGSVTIEAPVLSAKNYFTSIKGDVKGALQLVHGSVAGAICQLDGPNVQLSQPRYVDLDGIAGLQMNVAALPSAPDADDEIKLTTR